MKKKLFFISILGFVVLVCIILLIPPVTTKVSSWTGIAASKIKYVAQTVVGAGVGLMLISFGVAALAAPVVGFTLIVIGLTILAYSLWPLFKSGSAMTVSSNLNNMGTAA